MLASLTSAWPKLEYASIILNPYLTANIFNFENVQHNYCPKIATLSSFSVGERLARLNIETLENTRSKVDLTSYYKSVNGLSCFTHYYFDVCKSQWYKNLVSLFT